MWELIAAPVAGALLGGVAGKMQDDANQAAYEDRVKLYKNMLRGAAFTGRYPNESMLNKPTSSGLWSGLIGGAGTGLQVGSAVSNWGDSSNLIKKTPVNKFSLPDVG